MTISELKALADDAEVGVDALALKMAIGGSIVVGDVVAIVERLVTATRSLPGPDPNEAFYAGTQWAPEEIERFRRSPGRIEPINSVQSPSMLQDRDLGDETGHTREDAFDVPRRLPDWPIGTLRAPCDASLLFPTPCLRPLCVCPTVPTKRLVTLAHGVPVFEHRLGFAP